MGCPACLPWCAPSVGLDCLDADQQLRGHPESRLADVNAEIIAVEGGRGVRAADHLALQVLPAEEGIDGELHGLRHAAQGELAIHFGGSIAIPLAERALVGGL